jgi:hypothetical protein
MKKAKRELHGYIKEIEGIINTNTSQSLSVEKKIVQTNKYVDFYFIKSPFLFANHVRDYIFNHKLEFYSIRTCKLFC